MSFSVVKFTLSVLTHLKCDSDETSRRQLETINRVMHSASDAIVGEYRLYIINYAKYNKSTKLMQRQQFTDTMSQLQRQFQLQNTIGMWITKFYSLYVSICYQESSSSSLSKTVTWSNLCNEQCVIPCCYVQFFKYYKRQTPMIVNC